MERDREYLYCAVDVETTGLDPIESELIQIAILPLYRDFTVDESREPFCIRVKAFDPTDRDGAFAVNGLDASEGMDHYESIEAFIAWYERLQAQSPFYKIQPLGQNYTFDLQFIRKWLGGLKQYSQFFGRNYNDSKVLANSINDIYMAHGLNEPFIYSSLAALAERFGIENDEHHDAMNDAKVTAHIYRALLQIVRPNTD